MGRGAGVPDPFGPRAPYELRSRHCGCRSLGVRAECLMPASGIVDEDCFEDYSTDPPEGRPRTGTHV
jgi:hypothetical protein